MIEVQKGESLRQYLIRTHACGMARLFIRQNKIESFRQAWKQCDNPEWMMWLAWRVLPPKKVLPLLKLINQEWLADDPVFYKEFTFASCFVHFNKITADKIREIMPELWI